MRSRIEIPFSKTKIVGLLFGAMIFIIVGILFISNSQGFVSPIMNNPKVIKIVGIAAVSFFSLCLFLILRKLNNNNPGLIIDSDGIFDNTNATSVGLIEWDDIIRVEKKQVASSRFLILYTNNPTKYINRAKNVFSKQVMNMNYNTYGSPISITSNSLKISFDELERLVKSEFDRIQRR